MDATPRQQAALHQLAAVPGVVGGMVFDGTGALVASEFPPVFDAGGLQQLAQQLSADGYFQDWLAGGQASIDMLFADGQVVVRSLSGSWLLVLCTQQANPQLLAMSLTQVVRRLRPQPGDGSRTGELPLAAPPAAPIETPLARLKAIVAAELGSHGGQALELLGAAKPGELSRAIADVEKMTRLFISKKKAEEIGRRMRACLGVSA